MVTAGVSMEILVCEDDRKQPWSITAQINLQSFDSF